MLLYSGFLLSLFLEYVRPGSYLPIINALKINSLVPILVLIITIFYKGPVSDSEIFRHRNTRLLLFFAGLLALSVLTAEVTEYSFKIFKVVLGFLFWYYMICKLVTSELRMKALFGVMSLSHALLLSLNTDLILHPETRSYIYGNTFLGDGNDFSLSVSIVIPMCLYLVMSTKKFTYRMLWVGVLIALILGIVGTQSRGASIAMACVFLMLWWKGRQKFVGLLLIAAVASVVVSFAPPVYFERMNTITNYQEEGSAMGRIMAWKTAIRMAEKYPILGVGTGHFAVKLGTEFRPEEFGNENLPWLTAHSSYFLLIGELGIPGISFFLFMLIGNYFANNRQLNESRTRRPELTRMFLMLNASLVAYAVGGAFLSVAYYPHLYVLAGLWAAASFIYARALTSDTNNSETTEESEEERANRIVWKTSSSQESSKALQ